MCDSPHFKQHFARHGYVVFRSLLSGDDICQITSIVNRIYQQWVHETSEAVIRDEQLINMQGLTHPQYFEGRHDERMTFFEAIAPRNLTRVLDDMFGSGLYFHNTQLFFNPWTPEKRPYWHRDLQYSSIDEALQAQEQRKLLALHVRIPLVPETGVELIPGTHRRWDSDLERHVRFELNGHQNHEFLPGATLISLEPGDVLVFSAQMIHRGHYASNLSRKALDICVGQPHALVSDLIDGQMLPLEEDLHHIQNHLWYLNAKAIASG
jgi:ectoine hydroxylase-related dioxygenase (phytanoyl-CoA dioxygenase family)